MNKERKKIKKRKKERKKGKKKEEEKRKKRKRKKKKREKFMLGLPWPPRVRWRSHLTPYVTWSTEFFTPSVTCFFVLPLREKKNDIGFIA